MQSRKQQAGFGAVGVLLVVVVLAVVGFAGYAVMKNNDKKDDSAKSDTSMTTTAASGSVSAKAADLRANLVTMGVEHMQLTDSAVDAALDGDKDAASKATALYKNGTDIGAAVGSVYGSDAEATFNKVWKLHLDEFVNYAVADSKGDEAGKTKALDSISDNYTKPLAAYLAKANPNLPEKTLNDVLSEHVAMTAAIIDAHVAGKYDDEQTKLAAADKHIATIFSTLAGGIVKQYPDKFKD